MEKGKILKHQEPKTELSDFTTSELLSELKKRDYPIFETLSDHNEEEIFNGQISDYEL